MPEDTWKYHLIGQLDDTHRAKLTDCMGEDGFTYKDLVERLSRLDSETAVSAAERYFTSEVDSTRIRNTAEALDVAIKWLNKIIEGVEDRREIVKVLGRARVRTWFTAQLKDYIDQRDVNSNGDLVARVSQWQALKGDERPIFAKKEARKQNTYSAGGLPKKGVVCFECGKTGHVARDCKKGDATGAVSKGDKPDLKGVKCFECGELGHKSPSCPKRKGKATKRVSTRRRRTEVLADNELLGRVNGYWFPMTLDTGASVSLIPREFVGEDAFTGRTEHLRGFDKNAPTIEAPIARVELEIGGRRVTREVAVVDGETLGWEGVFSSRLGSREEPTSSWSSRRLEKPYQRIRLSTSHPGCVEGERCLELCHGRNLLLWNRDQLNLFLSCLTLYTRAPRTLVQTSLSLRTRGLHPCPLLKSRSTRVV